MAFTSTHGYAAPRSHSVEVQANGEVRHLPLYDLPGTEAQPNRGDLWKFPMTRFHFTNSCITIGEISRVYIVERSDDDWIIDSIVTMAKDADGGVQILTQNLDVYRLVDGDGRYPPNWRFELTNA